MLIVRCIKDGVPGVEKGQELRVEYIENGWYHFSYNPEEDTPEYSPDDFEIIRADKVVYHGESDPMYFMDGQEYVVLGVEEDGILHVVDETGDDYMYSPRPFTEVLPDRKD